MSGQSTTGLSRRYVNVVFSRTTITTITEAILDSTYTIEIKASNILEYGPTAVTMTGKPVVNIGGEISTCSCTSICSVFSCYS